MERFNIMNNFDPREVIRLPLDIIKPNKNNPYIKEEHLEKIIALKNDILHEGLNNPIVVEDSEDGYIINKGHSRYYAYQMINDDKIPGYEEIECYVAHFENEAEALRSLMRDNATQKERTVQDKCREVKMHLEKVIPTIRNNPENKGIPTKQLIANDLGMSATTVQQFLTIIKSDEKILNMFLNKKINVQGAYAIATSDFKDEMIEVVNNYVKSVNKDVSTKDIEMLEKDLKYAKKQNDLKSQKTKPVKKEEPIIHNENHIIFLKDNLLSVSHSKDKHPLETKLEMFNGSKLIIKCWWTLGRIQFSWICNHDEYTLSTSFVQFTSKNNEQNKEIIKISHCLYSYMVNQLITDSYLRNTQKYNDLTSLVEASIQFVKAFINSKK